jgi:hypothetical protein
MPRPRLKPTDEQRRMVKAMAAMGIRQERIAGMLGIKSPKTLRKFFHQELDRGATEATFNMEQALYKNGMAGNVTAQIYWSNRHRHCFEPASKPDATPPPFIVYPEKPEQAEKPEEPEKKGKP